MKIFEPFLGQVVAFVGETHLIAFDTYALGMLLKIYIRSAFYSLFLCGGWVIIDNVLVNQCQTLCSICISASTIKE